MTPLATAIKEEHKEIEAIPACPGMQEGEGCDGTWVMAAEHKRQSNKQER